MYEYLQLGAIEVVGIEEDGEFIFKVTELAKEVAPELWQIHTEEIDRVFLELFDMGLVNITYNENLEAEFELTEEGRRAAKEYGIVEIEKDSDEIEKDLDEIEKDLDKINLSNRHIYKSKFKSNLSLNIVYNFDFYLEFIEL
jgi:predicted transcriptional regulator